MLKLNKILLSPLQFISVALCIAALHGCGDNSVTNDAEAIVTNTANSANNEANPVKDIGLAKNAVLAKKDGRVLTQAQLDAYLQVGESMAQAPFDNTQKKTIQQRIITDFQQSPAELNNTLSQYQALAAQLNATGDGAEGKARLEELFTNLTQSTIREFLAPDGAENLPTDPFDLVLLAEQRVGDFSQITSQLIAAGDMRGFIFAKHTPSESAIEDAILALHDIALTNSFAMSGMSSVNQSSN